MKKLTFLLLSVLGISFLMGTGTSCSREMFDEQKYDTIVKIVSPVDSIDPQHTWSLTETKYIIVNVNAGVDTRKIQILSENPMVSKSIQVITEAEAREGDQIGLYISYPKICSSLFVASIDAGGKYTIATFNTSESNVDFSKSLVNQQQLSYLSLPQYYAFCYEQEFPEPGDYDYNDVVMHIALERVSSTITYFHVRLAAVGADQQIAGSIRLPGVLFEEVDSVWTLNDESFNKGISDQYMIVQKSRELLLKGLNGEAVLNLFADAHWATGDVLNADYGMFTRKQYNVTKKSDSKSQLMVPREVTFVVRSKNANRLSSLTLNSIDPFIIKGYNSAIMEIHTFNYRKVTALNEYHYHDTGNLPWALMIPINGFRHPLQGVNIGFSTNGGGTQYLFGAYAKRGSSFGEWSMNRNSCLNWYEPDNATINQVFVW